MCALISNFVRLLFLLPLTIHSQSIESRINKLSYVDISIVSDSTSKICWDIYLLPSSEAKPLVKKILSATKQININTYLVAQQLAAKYEGKNFLNKLDSIYSIAEKEKLYQHMGWTYEAKSDYYKQTGKYDSSMICILKARDLYELGGFTDDLVTVLHTIGDLYYTVDLLNEAELNYREVVRLQGENSQWEHWRKRVIRNNFGLIEAKRNNIDAAIDSFKISINEVQSKNEGLIDSIALSYMYSRLADYYREIEEYDEAKFYFNLGIDPAIDCNQYEFAAELYLTNSRLMLKRNLPDSALFYAKLSMNLAETKFNSVDFCSRLTKHIADIYHENNDSANELLYTKRWAELNDSLIVIKSNWNHIQLLDKKEYEKLASRVKEQHDSIVSLLITGVILLFILAITILLIVRLTRANKKLANKKVSGDEKGKILNSTETQNTEANNNKSDLEIEQLEKLINRLKHEMETNRLFLDSDLTIQKLAEVLDTNRTYLSKAINYILNMNYSTYINKLRIKESIELIKDKQYELINIEGIAARCGFKSRSSFIKSFTAYTGVTPSTFINSCKKSSEEITLVD